MEKTKGKAWKFIVIINVVLSLGLIAFAGYSYKKYTDENKKANVLLAQKEELLEKNNLKEKSKQEIEEKLEELKNIDEVYENTKKEVFALASELEKKIQNKETKYKIAYLTFDDGPYYTTYKFLETLHKYDVKATFFTTTVNGEKCYDNKNANCYLLYQEYLKDGHTIANHTYTHGIWRGLYTSADSFMNAVIKQEDHIKNYASGYTPNILRFPGGSSQAGSKKSAIVQKLRDRGYGYVDWTANDGDGKTCGSKDNAWSIFKNTINDSIEVVLFHDYCSTTLNILPQAIEYLQQRDYILLPLFYDSVMVNK